MGNQLAAPARVQPGELLASDVPSLVYKDSLGGETSARHHPSRSAPPDPDPPRDAIRGVQMRPEAVTPRQSPSPLETQAGASSRRS